MDNRSLDQLQQFAGFLEFLSKPEEYRKLLADLKQAATKYNEEASDIRATKEFQLWRNEQIALLDKREAEQVAYKAILEDKNEKARKKLDDDNKEIGSKKEATAEAWKAVSEKLATLEGVAKATEDLAKKQEAFAKAQEAHLVRVAEFDKKAAAFAALLKD